jgi:hypothetical protein
MLISSLLSLSFALSTQANDPTRGPRAAYSACLRRYMEASVTAHKSQSDFDSSLPQQCTAEAQAYTAAVRARETGFRTPAAEIDSIIHDELEDARTNMREVFAMATTPR